MKFDSDTVQTTIPSPLGPVILAANTRGLCGLFFDDQRHLPDMAGWQAAPADHPLLKQAARAMAAYFAGQPVDFAALPLDLASGTPFQQSVWQALLAIPNGQTTSYGDISRRVGKPSAFRAVGAAIGRNPISVIVPCHRVIGAGGSLTGYAGGLHRKTALLKLEGVL